MLKGRVRITMRPLLYRVPVVGAVQASNSAQLLRRCNDT